MSILTPQASDVYISEVNFSQTLSQVANAIASQVIVSGRGPLGPVFWADPQSYLGAYGNANASVSFDQYCGLDYFKEGNGMWANRVVEADARYAAAIVLARTDGTTAIRSLSAGIAQSEISFPDWTSYVTPGETPLYVIYANGGPGSYADAYALALQANNLAVVTNLAGTSNSTGGSLGSGTFTYAVAAVSASGAETLASTPATVIISSSPTTNTVMLTWTPVPGAVAYNIYGRASTLPAMGLLATVGTSVASWTDDGLDVPGTQKPIISPANVTVNQGFTLQVFDQGVSNSTPAESFACTLLDGVDGTGSPTEATQRINPYSQYIGVISYIPSLVTLPILNSVSAQVNLKGGTSGSAPTTATINAGWAVFTNKSKYTIDTMMNCGRATPVVQLAMDQVAQTRAECAAFLDVPSAQQTANNAIDYRNVTLNLNSSYSALFTPDLLESDPISGKFLFVPPSGMMCGLFARTTNMAQPWFSMAGLNRGLLKCLDVRYTYEDANGGTGEMTRMFQNQVNYMRKFQGAGIALWEQNTLASQSSALQFLNVRMLCNVIKRAAYSYLIYGLQDPLDDILKLELVNGLTEYLKVVQSGRGISSSQVISDKSNNPDLLANSGILAIAIIIVPILAVQRIQLTLGISKQGLQLSEATVAAASL
jgi:phage tail sheath protein FI